MKEGTSVEQHLKLMKDLTDQLAAIEALIAEEDKVVMLLGSLPQIYSNLVTAFKAQKDLVQLDFLQQALLHEEQKQLLHSQVASRSRDNTALMGGKLSKRPSRQSPQCYNCQKFGHFVQDCKATKKNRDPTDSGTKSHKVKAAHKHYSDSDVSGAFSVVLLSVGQSSDDWLIDSGASSHMMHEKKKLRDYHEFDKSENVAFG